MSERSFDEERRLRRAAVTRFGQVPEDDEPAGADRPADKTDEDDNAASQRMEQQTLWVDLQVRAAINRGEFENLPGAGKPLHLPAQHDPDWWVKRLIEREKISGVAPPAIALRHEDAELDDTLDREWSEDGVRRLVEDFNRRVIEARRQLTGGPPVITKPRDPDVQVDRWRDRRAAAREAARRRRPAASGAAASPGSGAAGGSSAADASGRVGRRRWWRRRPGRAAPSAPPPAPAPPPTSDGQE